MSTAFLHARLYGDRDTDLDGQYIYMRPPRVMEKLGLLPEGTTWKLKKALCGLRTSPLAWEVERDNSLAQLQWDVNLMEHGVVLLKRRAIRVCGRWFDCMLRMASYPRGPGRDDS